MEPKEIRKVLEVIWTNMTAYPILCPHSQTVRQAISRGQCYPTALLVRKILGGKVVKATHNNEIHYWNRLPDGREVDLTSDQYGGNGIDPVCKADSVRRSPNYNNHRFKILWRRWKENVPTKQ